MSSIEKIAEDQLIAYTHTPTARQRLTQAITSIGSGLVGGLAAHALSPGNKTNIITAAILSSALGAERAKPSRYVIMPREDKDYSLDKIAKAICDSNAVHEAKEQLVLNSKASDKNKVKGWKELEATHCEKIARAIEGFSGSHHSLHEQMFPANSRPTGLIGADEAVVGGNASSGDTSATPAADISVGKGYL